MKTVTLSISVPQELDVDNQSAKELLVLALVDSGRLSQSQGARVLGVSRYDLIELMDAYGLPVLHLSELEVEVERQNLVQLQAVRSRSSIQTTASSPVQTPHRKSTKRPV